MNGETDAVILCCSLHKFRFYMQQKMSVAWPGLAGLLAKYG